MHVLFDTSPLKTGHSHRGIGLYTKLLSEQLRQRPDLTLSFSLAEAKKKSQKIDIVHYPYFDLFFHTLPLRKPAPKSVVTIHDVIPLEFPKQYRPGKKGTLALYAQKLALSGVNVVLTDSLSSQKSIVSRLRVPEKKTRVVYLAANPVFKAQKPETVEEVRTKLDVPSTYILYVGDINYNKNLPQLIKSLKFLEPSIHLVLFGKNFTKQDIPEWQWIETQIAMSDVSSRVHFVTQVDSDKEIAALYSGALAYVQPSLAEGFGLPVLEALRCKTIVVSSNTTSLPEVGGNHVFYADPVAESLAEAIEHVQKLSPEERTVKIMDGYTWSQTFSWQKTADETIAVYQSLVGIS